MKCVVVFQGQGSFIYPSGDKYIGGWIKNWENGYGSYIYGKYSGLSGDKYEGEFKNGLPNGPGIFTFESGEVWAGEWENGKRIGS